MGKYKRFQKVDKKVTVCPTLLVQFSTNHYCFQTSKSSAVQNSYIKVKLLKYFLPIIQNMGTMMQTHKFQSIYPDSKATSDHNNKSTLKTFPQPY